MPRALSLLLVLLAACEKQQETITTTLPDEPAAPRPVERTVERPVEPKTLLTVEIARQAGFGEGVAVRCTESTARTASFEIVDAQVRGMLFAYVHDDDAQAKARFETTASRRGASGPSYAFLDGATVEAGRLAGRLTLTVRLAGSNAGRLAPALLEQLAR